MKHTLTLFALTVFSLSASAASTDPLDFDYQINGNLAERPALVFNDGTDTFVQPRAGQLLKVDGGHPEGPYIVVPGTPDVVSYSVGGASARARWKKANSFASDRGNGSGDMPAGFAGFSNRLAIVGTRSRLESTRSMSATLPLAQLVKALVPQGWTGSAQKDVDLTTAQSYATRDGENWMQSLDRLLGADDLYADVDFNAHHVTLRRAGAKSMAVNYLASAAPAVASAPPSATPAEPIAAPEKSPQSDGLAGSFGAVAIRDGDDTHIQIRFAQRPAKELVFRDMEGHSLKPKWDESSNVVTLNRTDRFVVSNGTDSVEVARVAGLVYSFDAKNSAGLEAVFDKDGSTYFKFADTIGNVKVSDARHLGSGEQKGRYYKFNGTADQFIVNADGNVVNVTRSHDVKFFDRPASVKPATAQAATAAVEKS
ncbi:TrbG/VirB9 family P-type conjugative transfer protein [Paraburkholderia sp. Tr-20389]|uniref:TrbG/VirB9 family P-type conjugative transfer protein n=1 Tax=Paraburkholderia sp. Tr-20389 TaxID=2703903 RepID=UPI00197F7D69|nr:TrbG/VirB9 family P-type conjugative transfer protein [Paraburkholderia sp. Tr-20389]MBN3754313.1 TrbG/VirB9 family P-type conjugative transfer protein [Paraburkholderia sp. Tr-20389]